MDYKRFLLQTVGLALLMLFFSACDASKSSSVPIPGDMKWDLVVIGDSLMSGVGQRYAAHLEHDLGIRIIVHDHIIGSCGSSCLLSVLRSGSELQQHLREAEVVLFEVGMAVFEGPTGKYAFGSPGACGGTDNQDCLREALEAYQDDTDAVFAEIVSLSNPSETLIRTMNIHQFVVKEFKAVEAFNVVNNYWRKANGHLTRVANEHHIPVAQVYAAFMGSNADEDPVDKGLVTIDGIHPTGKGTDLMAELFRELGYDYAPQQP